MSGDGRDGSALAAGSDTAGGPPLVPAPLYGLRTWRVVGAPGEERLAGPQRPAPWPDGGEWLRAVCGQGAGHDAPYAACDCGIHAWHPRRRSARRVFACRREVPGILEAWGAVELHADGLRAERARPYALVAAPGRNGAQIARLAARYDAQVIEARGPDELLAWCRERNLGVSEAVVARLLGPDRAKPRGISRGDVLRVAAALLIAALLVLGGLQFITDPPGPRTINGRTGEIHVN